MLTSRNITKTQKSGKVQQIEQVENRSVRPAWEDSFLPAVPPSQEVALSLSIQITMETSLCYWWGTGWMRGTSSNGQMDCEFGGRSLLCRSRIQEKTPSHPAPAQWWLCFGQRCSVRKVGGPHCYSSLSMFERWNQSGHPIPCTLQIDTKNRAKPLWVHSLVWRSMSQW